MEEEFNSFIKRMSKKKYKFVVKELDTIMHTGMELAEKIQVSVNWLKTMGIGYRDAMFMALWVAGGLSQELNSKGGSDGRS